MPAAGCANGGNRRSTPVPLSGGTPPTDWLDFALFTPCCISEITKCMSECDLVMSEVVGYSTVVESKAAAACVPVGGEARVICPR
ncbi:MAG: hypothetical protein V7L29_31270 [Nostoc sp.]|uniref:hypothetical protein n=1 Tax=Nostoc sp. TaxID=1180 RepID=UPI002FF124AA